MIEIKNLSKIYNTPDCQVHAVDDLSFCLPNKGMVFVLGKSGCGKSTLLGLLAGLLKPTSGEVLFEGQDITKLARGKEAQHINNNVAFMFQDFNLIGDYTVGQNLQLAQKLQGKSPSDEQIDSILQSLDILELKNQKANTLSGGQEQRVAIARALIKDSKVIFADEPTGNLDSKSGRRVFDTLKHISKDRLVVVVSHDKEFAQLFADRIISMRGGKICADTAEIQHTQANSTLNLSRHVHLPLKSVLRLSLGIIMRKKFVISVTAFFCALLIAMLGVAIGYVTTTKNSLLAARLLAHSQTFTMTNGQNVGAGNEKTLDIAEIMQGGGSGLVYDISFSSYESAVTTLYSSRAMYFDMCEADQKMSQNFTMLGTFPQNYDQIAINSYIAEMLMANTIKLNSQEGVVQEHNFASLEDILGQKIYYQNDGGRVLTISGIVLLNLQAFSTLNEITLSEYTDLLNDDPDSKDTLLLENLFTEFSTISDVNMLFVKKGFTQSMLAPDGIATLPFKYFVAMKGTIAISSRFALLKHAEQIYWKDNVPQTELEENQIVVSSQFLSRYYNAYTEQQILQAGQALMSQSLLLSIRNERDAKNASTHFLMNNVYVVGIEMSSDSSYDMVFVSQHIYDGMSLHLKPSYKYATAVNGDLTTLAERVDMLYQAKLNISASLDSMGSAAKLLGSINSIFVLIIIVSTTLLSGFILMVLNQSVSVAKKKIGILKSLGARGMDINLIFGLEALLLLLATSLVGIIIMSIAISWVNTALKSLLSMSYSLLIVPYYAYLIVFGFVALLTAIASALPITRVNLLKPLDILKGE